MLKLAKFVLYGFLREINLEVDLRKPKMNNQGMEYRKKLRKTGSENQEVKL